MIANANAAAESNALVLNNPNVDREDKVHAFVRMLLDGAYSKATVRESWRILLNLDPESIPRAEADGANNSRRLGRAAVVRTGWTAMSDAGAFSELAQQVAIREWDDQVQMSLGPTRELFHWGGSSSVTVGVYAESAEGRVAMGIRRGPELTIPHGLVVVDRVSPRALAQNYPGVHLAG